MASDQRWTGGIANREWRSGTKPEQPVDTDGVKRQVAEYIADCVKNHLTSNETGCLKVVFHKTGAQKQAVIWAFREQKAQQYDAAEQRGTDTARRVLAEHAARAAMPGVTG